MAACQDLATESLPTIERKCLRFIAYWRSGVEQQQCGVFPEVLWVVPDEHRRANVERVLGRKALRDSGLFRVTLAQEAVEALVNLPLENSFSRPPP